jgi:hypothetical protein
VLRSLIYAFSQIRGMREVMCRGAECNRYDVPWACVWTPPVVRGEDDPAWTEGAFTDTRNVGEAIRWWSRRLVLVIEATLFFCSPLNSISKDL